MRQFAGRNSRRPRHRGGFALLDVIVGGIILGIGLSVILSLASRSLASHNDGEKRLIASWLADELLAMVVVEGPENYSQSYDLVGEFYPPFDEFAYEVEIENMGPYLPRQVTARVHWPSGSGYEHIEVVTMITEMADELDEDERDIEDLLNREPIDPLDRDERHYERRHNDYY